MPSQVPLLANPTTLTLRRRKALLSAFACADPLDTCYVTSR